MIISLALLQQSHTCTGLIWHSWVLEGSAWLRGSPTPLQTPTLPLAGQSVISGTVSLPWSIWSSPAEAQTWLCICYLWNVAEQKPQGSFPLSSLPKFFHHWPELEEGARGLSHLQVPDPVTAEVFSPASPHRYFFRMRPIWAPSIFPRRVYFPEKTELLMLREIISLRPVLWSFGYTPYLVCCWEGVVSVFCIWHVDGNS